MNIFTFIILFFGFLTPSALDFSSTKENQDLNENISQSYFKDFLLFQKEINELARIATEEKTEVNLPILRAQFIETRHAYKRIEFLFDYLQTTYNYLYINGAPLPKNSEESNDIVEPNGLQTIDELLFSNDAADQITSIRELAKELKKSIDLIAESHIHENISDQRIIEALRSGVIRVFTLGVTGFDTPGCGNALQEAMVSMESMEKTFLFFGENVNIEAKDEFQKVMDLYCESLLFLKANNHFETFDRMAFLKEIINPLYEHLLAFQKLNGIKTSQYKFHAQNYQSKNLFDENFLSTDVYSESSFLPLNNPSTIRLGKMLFYDPILSKDMKMSCATCHDPKKAFSDGLPKSKTNFFGKFTQRNAPTLIDAGYSSRYFWDMRDYNLERQVTHVVNNPLEFNTQFSEIAEKLSHSATYVQLFEENYSEIARKPIYQRSISNAIAAYVNSLKSFDSEFDQYARNEINNYPEEAINGFNLFMGKAACGTCHFAPIFNGTVPPFYLETESEVLGITLGFDTIQPQIDQDPGRMKNGLKREEFPHFENSFKTVSLRNVALTAPYMHNGLFETLEDVLEFYNRGGGAGLGLEIENQTLSDEPLNLTEKEKKDIISFLHTLTDTTGLTTININLPQFEDRPEWNDRGY